MCFDVILEKISGPFIILHCKFSSVFNMRSLVIAVKFLIYNLALIAFKVLLVIAGLSQSRESVPEELSF